MYYSYFNLDRTTFSSVPILKFVVKTHSFQTVWTDLQKGFRSGKTIGIVTGETGTGKTLLCHCLIRNLSSTNLLVTIKANPHHTTVDTLTDICDQLQVDYPDKCSDEVLILGRLHDFFVSSKDKNKRIVIIIDEAQYIAEDLFRHLALLVHSDTVEEAKQNIILAGNSELIDSLQTIGFVSEIEKDVVRSELKAMNKQDSIVYIRHRLAVGGIKNRIFTSGAESDIFQHTKGIPRLINLICDYSLRIAHKRSESIITSKIVKRAIKKNFPTLLSIKDGALKQKVTQFKNTPKMIINGASSKFGEVWQPLQKKVVTKNKSLKQKIKLEKPINLIKNVISLKKSSKKKVLKANKTSTLPPAFKDEELSDHNPTGNKVANISPSKQDTYTSSYPTSEDMVVISKGLLKSAYSDDEIIVDSFLMDLMPVTNKQYSAFIEATNYSPPDHWWNKKVAKDLFDHPIVGVSYEDANQFAKWMGKRLPTVKEWEMAARCPDNRKFPWGNDKESFHFNSIESNLNKTTPVDIHPEGASSNGCLDLVGNVWEWVDDSEKLDLEDGYAFVFGGSFRHQCITNGAIARTQLLQMNHYAYVGFRCAKNHNE